MKKLIFFCLCFILISDTNHLFQKASIINAAYSWTIAIGTRSKTSSKMKGILTKCMMSAAASQGLKEPSKYFILF